MNLSLKTLLRPLYHRAFRAQLRVRFWVADRLGATASPDGGIALPPALLRYRVSESLSIESFLRIGRRCAEYIEEQVRASGISLRDAGRVLDFGCGCGRTLRWLMEGYPATQFYGADVDQEAVEWCNHNLTKGVFSASQPMPPLPFQDAYFDVVYCFSVFTHLNEQMQDLWLVEIKRILKPGGIVVLTVHGEGAAAALDHEGARRLKATGFVHQESRKLFGLVPDWYHTSWHSRSYIAAKLGALFSEVRYEVVADGMQDLVVARNSRLP